MQRIRLESAKGFYFSALQHLNTSVFFFTTHVQHGRLTSVFFLFLILRFGEGRGAPDVGLGALQGAGSQFTCFTGTQVQILTLRGAHVGLSALERALLRLC